MPKISVIVPVYNVEPYLRRCVDSVLSQTYADFELILIDDGSTDRSGQLCDEYLKADRRVTVFHRENGGVSAARNTGIEYALESDSAWITFIDSDDYVSDRYLEALLDAAQEYGISVGARVMTKGEDLPEFTSWTVESYSPAELYYRKKGNFTISAGKMFRKELFSSIRFPEGRIHEDSFTIYKILFRFDEIPFVPQYLYAHYKNPESITMSAWTPARLDALDALEEQIGYLTDNGHLKVAEVKFHQYIKLSLKYQNSLIRYEELPIKDKNMLLRKTNRQFRQMLMRYRKYRWCRWWERKKDLVAVAYAVNPRLAVAVRDWLNRSNGTGK